MARKLRVDPASAGMALIAVLWVVAALSILVTGISRASRDEIRVVAIHGQAVRAQAIGDAAIQLALQELASRPARPNRVMQSNFTYRGVQVSVAIAPLNGWIDLNGAPQTLLARLYEVAGGLPPDAAQKLAQFTIDARERKDLQGQSERFEAPEDLLRLPGVDYDLYARLSPLVTVYSGAGSRVNPMAAPVGVLKVLAGGNEAVALRIVQERASGSETMDTTALDPAWTAVVPSLQYRIDAIVPLNDGSVLRVVRIMDVGVSARDGLPWRTFHSERSVESVHRIQ